MLKEVYWECSLTLDKENTDKKKKKKTLTITTETSIKYMCYPIAVALKIRNVEFFSKYRALTRYFFK